LSKTADQGRSSRQRKSELRSLVRAKRRSLTPRERKLADLRICANLQRMHAVRRARVIAAYLAFDGEPSLVNLIRDRRSATKRFVVPVIKSQRMRFAPPGAHWRLRRNSFGIAEPNHRIRVPTSTIDIVLVPLVAFDEHGRRLGMGGGYYDRYFNYLLGRKSFLRPRLIGVAYELQRVAEIPRDSWDVPLHGIVTDVKIRKT
jgi:5-formyltetrahydrofolate cyclo-ligase